MGVKSIGVNTWQLLGWLVTGYSIYTQLKTLNEMKDLMYPYLSEEEQAAWNKYLGKPHVEAALNPFPAMSPKAPVPSTIEHLTAAT